MTEKKAFWKDKEILIIGEMKDGFAEIIYKEDWYHSPWTGTGRCWVSLDAIVVKEVEVEE